jgi:GMP synthase-like glutamine amidotransferase
MAEFREILVFKHMPSQNPGIFRDFAADHGIRFSEIDLNAGDPIPDLDRFDGLWAMGGTMNAWEEASYPWLVDEKRVIRDVVENRNLPFLGICLGHQLLAESLGGKVAPGKFHEIGAFAIQPTRDGKNHPLLQGLPPALRWTNVHTAEVAVSPAGATVLAKSKRCANQIMAVSNKAYSVQFHPEVCETTLADWLKIPDIVPVLVDLLGEAEFEQFKSDIELNRLESNLGARQLFENWLSLVF